MEGGNNKRKNAYGDLVDTINANKEISEKEKKDIRIGISASMRDELFGGTGSIDVLQLKLLVLSLDADITQAKKVFAEKSGISACLKLKGLCVKQKNNLAEYFKKEKSPLNLKNKDLDALLKQCTDYERGVQKAKEEKEKRLQEASNKILAYDKELAEYKDSDKCYQLSYRECLNVIEKAKKLKKEIEFLKENKQRVPCITWFAPDFLISKMENQMKKIKAKGEELIADIKNRDEAISSMIHRDYRGLSIDDCFRIIGVCKDQKRKIEYCKEKGYFVPQLNNGNVDYLIERFEKLRQGKVDWEKERKERERQKREGQKQERERLQREREQRKQERLQREREKQEQERLQREREKREREQREQEWLQRVREKREQERLQREREQHEREKQNREREEQKRKERLKNEKTLEHIYSQMLDYVAEERHYRDLLDRASCDKVDYKLIEKALSLNKKVRDFAEQIIAMHQKCKIEAKNKTVQIVREFLFSANCSCYSYVSYLKSFIGVRSAFSFDTKSIQRRIVDLEEEEKVLSALKDKMQSIEWGFGVR